MTTAIAHPNIALVKYWGKRDHALNLPATGSLSLTLGPVRTRTSVVWGQGVDSLVLNGVPQRERELRRITALLDLVRQDHPQLGGAAVVSDNDFPTAAGLASSSSGFAALALAATRAAGLELPERELSVLARRGSGSAARSLRGGFVRMHPGERADGSDAFATSVAGPDHWDLRVVFALTMTGAKKVPSTDGMNDTVATSPYFRAWTERVPHQLDEALAAIGTRDFERLAAVAEASALQMHASAIAAEPGVLYWNGATVELIHRVRGLRLEQGMPAFFTIDAGPHVKVFTVPEHVDAVRAALEDTPGVHGTFVASPGGDARVVEEQP